RAGMLAFKGVKIFDTIAHLGEGMGVENVLDHNVAECVEAATLRRCHEDERIMDRKTLAYFGKSGQTNSPSTASSVRSRVSLLRTRVCCKRSVVSVNSVISAVKASCLSSMTRRTAGAALSIVQVAIR